MWRNLFTLANILVLSVKCLTELPEPVHTLYLDVTTLVDKYLEYQDQVTSTHLKKGLAISTNVFYSTDLLLNDIMKLRPVVDALNAYKPNNDSLSIQLSLRYSVDQAFIEARLKDVFYDRSLKITTESWADVFQNVNTIFLDFSSLCCQSNVSIEEQNKLRELLNYSYPQYIKSFNNMYCGNSDFCNVPIGITYDINELTCANNLSNQYQSADKIMIYQEFDALMKFPLSNSAFRKIVSSVETRHKQTLSNIPQLYIHLNENPTVEEISGTWQYKTKKIVESSKYFNDVVQDLSSKAFLKSLDILLEYSSMFQNSDSEFGLYTVVLGSELTEHLVHRASGFKMHNEPVSLISSFYTKKASKSACELALLLNKTEGGNVIMDHYTWRAMARYKNQIDNVSNACANGTYPKSLPYNNVHLVFESGIKATWPVLESTMDKFLTEFKKIGNATLKTILFHEEDLYLKDKRFYFFERFKAFNTPIVRFLDNHASNYWIGCVVRILAVIFVERTTGKDFAFGNGSLLNSFASTEPESQIRKLFSKACAPIFDKVKVMVWLLPKTFSEIEYSLGVHLWVATLRTLFLKEYPSKHLFLDYVDALNKTEAENFARFYDIPVVYRS